MLYSIIPILNKIDLPASDLEKTKKQIEEVIGIDTEGAIPCSGKTGEGIDNILEQIITVLPGPKGESSGDLKCLLVDSWYDTYLGVVILVRVIDGKISKNMKIKMMSTNQEYIIEKVGVFTPKPIDVEELNSGEIGFIKKSKDYLQEISVNNKSLIIHGCAFESLVSDLILQSLREKNEIKSVKTFYKFNLPVFFMVIFHLCTLLLY